MTAESEIWQNTATLQEGKLDLAGGPKQQMTATFIVKRCVHHVVFLYDACRATGLNRSLPLAWKGKKGQRGKKGQKGRQKIKASVQFVHTDLYCGMAGWTTAAAANTAAPTASAAAYDDATAALSARF